MAKQEFYDILSLLSTTASEFKHEKPVRDSMINMLEHEADKIEQDDFGNLYVFREGKKPGTVMFSAHQDKVMSSNGIGAVFRARERKASKFNSNVALGMEEYADRIYNSTLWLENGSGFFKAELAKDSVLEGLVKVKHKDFDKSTIFIPRGIWIDTKDCAVDSFASLYSLPNLFVSDDTVTGKLDDALGLSIITEMFYQTERADTPSMLAVFTVGEEAGMQGASYAVENGLEQKYKVDKCIVIDVTILQEPGNGIVLYRNCAHKQPSAGAYTPHLVSSDTTDTMETIRSYLGYRLSDDDLGAAQVLQGMEQSPADPTAIQKEPLVAELEESAERYSIPLTTRDAFSNDSRVFATETNIPTVALEVPLLNMHSRLETASKNDIDLIRHFISSYLTNY